MDLLGLPRAVTASSLALGTAVRSARIVHPRGRAFTGTVRTDGGGSWEPRSSTPEYMKDAPAINNPRSRRGSRAQRGHRTVT